MSEMPVRERPPIHLIQLAIEDEVLGECYSITVPGRSAREAIEFLDAAGGGLAGSGVWNTYLGNVLGPVRDAYHRANAALEAEIARRLAALGPSATDAQLRELMEWAVRRRAALARMWRWPTGPTQTVMLELRDWAKYGAGGRTPGNLMRRQPVAGAAGYRRVLRSAATSNAAVDASVARTARHLRLGGGILGVLGLGLTAHQIASAPPGERGEVAARAAVGIAGGLVAGEIAAGMVVAGGAILLATPPGWLLLGVGLVAGVVGGIIAERLVFPDDAAAVQRQWEAGAIAQCGRYPCVCPR